MSGTKIGWFLVLTVAGLLNGEGVSGRGAEAGAAVGVFEGRGDVGTVLHAGSVDYNGAKGSYTLGASGYNVWFEKDAFQFAWKKMSGDLTLSADISFVGTSAQEHRKAVLMVRQSLDEDSPYADVTLHGNGMTALQYRDARGALTHEIQAPRWSPTHLRIEKQGAYFTMWLTYDNGALKVAAGSARLEFKEPFYVGIGLCSHEKDTVEKAVFTNVELKAIASTSDAKPTLYSLFEVITVNSTDRTAIYVAPERFEAPNWMPDGKTLLFNRNGRIEKIPATGGATQVLDTGFATRCNNDHLVSPDGKSLGISDASQEDHKSLVYIAPIDGGAPRRITQKSPSYLHGWSPDGKMLSFVGERNGDFDIYAISAAGGEEKQLTTAKGLDDGPEYSPDGTYIYFNSERTGHMQIWRMRADGSEQEQVTFGEENDWFPHLSPDGQQMVFLSYDASVKGHPENKDVTLRIMTLKDKKITVLAKLFGGQGTINVPSWSPDGTKLAFVSYALVPTTNGGK